MDTGRTGLQPMFTVKHRMQQDSVLRGRWGQRANKGKDRQMDRRLLGAGLPGGAAGRAEVPAGWAGKALPGPHSSSAGRCSGVCPAAFHAA